MFHAPSLGELCGCFVPVLIVIAVVVWLLQSSKKPSDRQSGLIRFKVQAVEIGGTQAVEFDVNCATAQEARAKAASMGYTVLLVTPQS